jgi:hypothetical protein
MLLHACTTTSLILFIPYGCLIIYTLLEFFLRTIFCFHWGRCSTCKCQSRLHHFISGPLQMLQVNSIDLICRNYTARRLVSVLISALTDESWPELRYLTLTSSYLRLGHSSRPLRHRHSRVPRIPLSIYLFRLLTDTTIIMFFSEWS